MSKIKCSKFNVGDIVSVNKPFELPIIVKIKNVWSSYNSYLYDCTSLDDEHTYTRKEDDLKLINKNIQTNESYNEGLTEEIDRLDFETSKKVYDIFNLTRELTDISDKIKKIREERDALLLKQKELLILYMKNDNGDWKTTWKNQ